MSSPILSNTFTKTVARNHADDSRVYYYRIVNGRLLYRVEAGEWRSMDNEVAINPWPPNAPGSAIGSIRMCAADNNRIFILTEDNQFCWRSLKPDSASWVILLFTIADLIGSADPAISQGVQVAIDQIPGLREQLDPQGTGTLDSQTLIWDQFDDPMKTIEGTPYTDLESWARDYRTWVEHTHQPLQGWNALGKRWWDVGMTYGSVHTSYGRFATHAEFLAGYDILDIAVGNWKDTVVTYYVLARPKPEVYPGAPPRIFFLDEEALVQSWREVPGQDSISLDGNSRICASHSVIAAVTCDPAGSGGCRMYWVRFDAHTCDNIKVWPINWTELWRDIHLPFGTEEYLGNHIDISHPYDMGAAGPLASLAPPLDVFDNANYPGWHTIDVPGKQIEEFRVDAAYRNRPWPVPKPYYSPLMGPLNYLSLPWKVYFLVAAISTVMDAFRGTHSEVGFLGDNPVKPNCDYPMCCVIKADGRYQGFALQSSMGELLVEWVDIDPEHSEPSWLCWLVEVVGHAVNRVRTLVCTTLRVKSCKGYDFLKILCLAWKWVTDTLCQWLTQAEEGAGKASNELKCLGCLKGLGDEDYPGGDKGA